MRIKYCYKTNDDKYEGNNMDQHVCYLQSALPVVSKCSVNHNGCKKSMLIKTWACFIQ